MPNYATRLTFKDGVTYLIKDAQATADLATKVDKVDGKGLSTNDFTDALKEKLEGLPSDKLITLRGVVAAYADLPTADVAVGDLYLVGTDTDVEYSEYVCTADDPAIKWERLGTVGAVDISGKANVDDVETWSDGFQFEQNDDGDDTFTLVIPRFEAT